MEKRFTPIHRALKFSGKKRDLSKPVEFDTFNTPNRRKTMTDEKQRRPGRPIGSIGTPSTRVRVPDPILPDVRGYIAEWKNDQKKGK
jgi:hypothetical protein